MNQLNFHQSPEEIIKNATAEQKIIWNQLFLLFGERLSIAQYTYTGTIAAAEFITYRARRIYFALEFIAGHTSASANNSYIQLYNQNNAVFLNLGACSAYWNSTAAVTWYVPFSKPWHNIWFSRIVNSGYQSCHFIGYRIIY